MKKTAAVVLAVLLTAFLLASCGGIDAERADKCAVDYMLALLSGDNEKLGSTLHPDHLESAMPDSGFFEKLESLDISVGDVLNGMDSVDKRYSDDTQLTGRVLVCDFAADINYMIYSVQFVILENDNGYGIVGCNVDFCTDEKYFQAVS